VGSADVADTWIIDFATDTRVNTGADDIFRVRNELAPGQN
jgi:hypothetical protein